MSKTSNFYSNLNTFLEHYINLRRFRITILWNKYSYQNILKYLLKYLHKKTWLSKNVRAATFRTLQWEAFKNLNYPPKKQKQTP